MTETGKPKSSVATGKGVGELEGTQKQREDIKLEENKNWKNATGNNYTGNMNS